MRHTLSGFALRAGMLFGLFLALAVLVQPAQAQVLYGSVTGNVSDQSGAVVVGATVSITNKGTGQVREATTSDDGTYTITSVLPGVYDLKVTKQGFTSYTETDVNVTANNVLRIDPKLKVGNVADVVSVTANATALQTESATVKSEISNKEIQALPINNYRNYQSLLNLVPGTTPAGFQNANTDTPERALTTNVNGTARNNNNTRLDGAQSVNIWLPHHSGYVPPSESIQEVNISTNNFDAEQGLAGGAAIQVITKSGTNEFHGSAFAYHDNHFFRAKNAFHPNQLGTNKPKNLRTIPGATFGGPIKKDKLFFFGSWEGMYERLIRDGRFTVPTADIRGGNFSAYNAIFDPTTGTLMNGSDRTQFAGNIIPTNRISRVAQAVLPLIPLPNLPGTNANYYSSGTQVFNRNNYDVKVNWNRTSNHQVWTKFSHMKADVTGQFALGAAGGGCVCDGGAGTGLTKSYVGTIGHTWTLGSGFVVDGNFSVQDRNHTTTSPDYGKNIGLDLLGIPGTNGTDIRQSGFPSINYGFTGLGNQASWMPVWREERGYTFTQNASKITGNHTLRFGADVVRHELNHWQPEIGVGPRGSIDFGGGATTLAGSGATNYNAFAAFLLGTPTSVQKSLQNELMTTREWQIGFFVSDRWQVTRNLTLSLGTRYEMFPTMVRADRGLERLDVDRNGLNFRLVPVSNPAPGVSPNGLPIIIGGKGNNPNNVGVEWGKNLFAPRVGFAYRMGDNMVIRGGYGITYDPMPFGRPLRGFFPGTIAVQNIPTGAGVVEGVTPWGYLGNAAGVITQRGIIGVNGLGIPPINSPDLSSGLIGLPGNVQMRSAYAGRLNRGMIQSWNLFVERKLPGDFKVEAGYVSTQTSNQFADIEINASQGPNLPRPLAALGRNASTLMWDGWLSSNYHALQVAINRRLSRGILIKGAYTYSAAINMTDDTGWAGVGWNAQSQIARNRARAGYDIPQNFQIGLSAELPFGKGKKWASDGAAATVLGGWQLSSIYSAVAGRPFSVSAAGGSVNSPGNSQTPDIIAPVTYLRGTGPGQSWFDPNAFRPVEFSLGNNATFPVASRRFGTAGRNILRNPGYANIDISLVRSFRLSEGVNLEFRVDSFNFTNTPHFGGAGTNSSAPSRDAAGNILKNADGSLRLNGFTEITSAAQDQRQFRFGIRLGF